MDGPVIIFFPRLCSFKAIFFCEANLLFCQWNGRILSNYVTHRHPHHRLKALNVISELNYGEGIGRLLAAELQVAHPRITMRCNTRWALHKKIASGDGWMDVRI